VTKWGKCQQPAKYPSDFCSFHARWMLKAPQQPDEGYHKKIALGLLEPAEDYLSGSELRATMNGRYRGDGRRLDFYVLWDPNPLEME
jgi:hypothetical protein